MKRTLAIVALSLATSAGATTILSTSMGFGVNGVNCFTLNTRTKPVEVDLVTFAFTDGTIMVPEASTCTYPGVISPGKACRDSLDIGTSHDAVRCVIVTKGNSKSIRGSMSLFDNSGAQSILETR
jgi:hypothetical protein